MNRFDYRRGAATALLASLMIGCGGPESNTSAESRVVTDVPPGAPGGRTMSAAEPATQEGVVLFIGTSLTAGLGLPEDQAYPAVIQEMIDESDLPFRVVNAGVSGETSAGALSRMEWLLQQPFDVVVLETGANDMLRGTDPAFAEENIERIIERIRTTAPDAPMILAGMLSMPNLGPQYARAFESIYPRLAEKHDLVLIPFLLEGVAGERELNQSDGVHPTAEGQRIVATTVWEALEPVLRQEAATVAGG
jgi:acyl-CoA thioesterase I